MAEFPEASHLVQMTQQYRWLMPGPVADPATIWLLDKSRVARLKIRQIDMAIAELEGHIQFLKLEQGMLKEEYRIT